MQSDSGHGPKLSEADYTAAVVALNEKLAPNASRAERQALARSEFELLIDHRLGTAFPVDRREELWRVYRRVARPSLRLLWNALVRPLRAARKGAEARRRAEGAVGAYAEVLSAEELDQFLGADEVARPELPVDGPIDG